MSCYFGICEIFFSDQRTDLNGDMNVNGITAADGDSQPGPHPPSSFPHQHHQSIMEYDYLWAPNLYNPAMGTSSGCGTGHGTAQKQQQPSHAFQGHYPVNRTIGSQQQPPVTREQYWGLGNPDQQQGGSSGTIRFSHGVYGVYPNQVHSGIPPVPHQSPKVLHHQQHQQQPPPQHLQPQQQHYGMVSNGLPCYQSQPGLLSSEQSESLNLLMPTAQMFTPLQLSPQHLHVGHGTTDSTPMQVSLSSTAQHRNGSPQRKQSPGRGSVAHSSGIQGEYYLKHTPKRFFDIMMNLRFSIFSNFLVQNCTLLLSSVKRMTQNYAHLLIV